jgi:hydroxymethylglutaryl-CoA reductase (NADPH)
MMIIRSRASVGRLCQRFLSTLEATSPDAHDISDDQILDMLKRKALRHHKLESFTGDALRAVSLRREYLGGVPAKLPQEDFDVADFYDRIDGANCENVIGYVPIPVGVAGPLVLDGVPFHVPMATTEGALIASVNRGARAIADSGGATTVLLKNGMTRAPALRCPDLITAASVKEFVENPANFQTLQDAFATTTRFGKLKDIKCYLAGRDLFVRMRCTTGDAMGMNMIGKGSNEVVSYILRQFPGVYLASLSGNMCTDKKPSAINWLEGRGKSCAAEVVIKAATVKKVLNTTVKNIVQANITKNLVGSAVGGSIGGNNAHAANMVTAVFLATGQDPAQNVESSNCITLMEETPEGDLRMSVSMPSIEVGTVGGGTTLPAQRGALEMLGVAGASQEPKLPGDNAKQLAKVVCGTVLAGELSLMAALADNHLMSAHMDLGRK